MLENIRGDSQGSIPPLRMPSLLPHDLCHEWNVSRGLPAPGDLSDAEIEPSCPVLQGDSLPSDSKKKTVKKVRAYPALQS